MAKAQTAQDVLESMAELVGEKMQVILWLTPFPAGKHCTCTLSANEAGLSTCPGSPIQKLGASVSGAILHHFKSRIKASTRPLWAMHYVLDALNASHRVVCWSLQL